MPERTLISNSEEETEAIAAELGRTLATPQVIALEGDLGAGKTTFVRAFVRALMHGEKVRVKSPSFALHHEYATLPVCHHLDLYRLSNAHHIEELGLLEIIDSATGFVLIEWPGVIAAQLPKNTVQIRLEERPDGARNIHIYSY